MEERVNKLNQQLNDYIVNNNLESSIIFQNIELFYNMSCDLIDVINDFDKISSVKEAVKNSQKMSFSEKITMLKEFYSSYNIELNLEKYIQDGTINLIESDIDDNPFYFNGRNEYINKHKSVDICNNGTIADLPIAVHELGHLRNQPEKKRSQLSHLFTESLARCDQLLFLNYLSKLGYIEETQKYNVHLLQLSYHNVYYAKSVLKMFLVFKELGDISKESYKMCFNNTTSYENELEIFESQIKQEDFYLECYVWYLFDTFISSYLFLKYNENENFMNNINELHSLINKGDMFDCLKLIGLNDLGEDDQKTLIHSIKERIKLTKIQ